MEGFEISDFKFEIDASASMTANASAVEVLSPGACDIKSTNAAGLPTNGCDAKPPNRGSETKLAPSLAGNVPAMNVPEQRQSGTPVLFSPTSRSDRDDVAFDEIRQITDHDPTTD